MFATRSGCRLRPLRWWSLILLAVLSLLVVGCPGGPSTECTDDSDCFSGERCVSGGCVPRDDDSGPGDDGGPGGDGGPADSAVDDPDGDGIGSDSDNCPQTPNPEQSDTDGDGTGDACDDDVDGDGVVNDSDNCPQVANGEQEDTDEDGTGDACDDDIDGDGTDNDADNCPETPNGEQNDTDGDGTGDACDDDIDGDGVPNGEDNCAMVANAEQTDTDGDGTGDACSDDFDGDGVDNEPDNCPKTPNQEQTDTDGDGTGDACDEDLDGDGVSNVEDNCRETPNQEQTDTDGDGDGDACDDDDDGDSVLDGDDNCPKTPNQQQTDTDGDGTGDACDDDDDGDGIRDSNDNCSKTPNQDQTDTDGDGDGDACDDDDDGDSVLDGNDNCPKTPNSGQDDYDGDGDGDACDRSYELGNFGTTFLPSSDDPEAGSSAARVGDVNGDGLDDFVIGHPGETTAASNDGAAYLFYGDGSRMGAQLQLSNADVKFHGAEGDHGLGTEVVALGDMNQDGTDDFAVAAENAYQTSGGNYITAYFIVFGESGFSSVVDIDQEADLRVEFTEVLTPTGDRDGDGNPDYLFHSTSQTDWDYHSGPIRGNSSRILDGTAGQASLTGLKREGDAAGGSDIDDDGRDDVVISNPFDDTGGTDAGTAYAAFADWSSLSGDSPISSNHDVQFIGQVDTSGTENNGERLGETVSFPGDVDGDGISDLLLGTRHNDPPAYLFLGKSSWSSPVNSSSADLKMTAGQIDAAGGVGEITGDQYDDMVVVDKSATGGTKGFLVPGESSLPSTFDVRTDADVEFVFPTDRTADPYVVRAGDVDGDGNDDFLIGDPQKSGSSKKGRVFLLYGPVPTP